MRLAAGFAIVSPVTVTREGRLPDGTLDRATFQVVNPAVFIVLKALAMDERLKPRDAYDIHFVLQHHPGGIEQLAGQFQQIIDNPTARKAFDILKDKFASPQHSGSVYAASERELSGVEAERVGRDASERVAALLEALGR